MTDYYLNDLFNGPAELTVLDSARSRELPLERVYCAEVCKDDDIDGHEPINGGQKIIHLACLIRTTGWVGHLRGLCSCFGGFEEDPEGATLREGALQAWQEWMRRR